MKGGGALELLPGELEQIKAETAEILQQHGTERQELIPIIQEIQERLGYLPKPAMEQVARALDIPEVDVYSVATFYNQFRLNPPGKHQIKVCMGTACHMMGGHIVMDSFERRLEIKEGETTPDREFSLERVACVGCCALAPVVLVDEKVEAKVSPIRVDGILLTFEIEKSEQEKVEEKEQQEGGVEE
ncbi:MAG: NADH-quinone oxidoreductase subunit NuoE [Syntrophomonadaceae bacterium]|jgi:NADH-quinone oxidoreductase subunit E|nr:NADH-quinone oxidoreductase subunit NuoE [Syntrophomonadaceae bacterium]